MPPAADATGLRHFPFFLQLAVLFDVQGADLFASTKLIETSPVYTEFSAFQRFVWVWKWVTVWQKHPYWWIVLLSCWVHSLCLCALYVFQFNPQRCVCIFSGHLIKQRLFLRSFHWVHLHAIFLLKQLIKQTGFGSVHPDIITELKQTE